MADPFANLLVGLQRMADNACQRGDDLRYLQHQEVYDHIDWLNQQLTMVEKVREVILEERKKFMGERRPALPQDTAEKMPRVVAQGPKAAQG